MSEPQRRRKFDSQFIHNALRMIQESNRRITDIEKDLGIRPELLYRWKNE